MIRGEFNQAKGFVFFPRVQREGSICGRKRESRFPAVLRKIEDVLWIRTPEQEVKVVGARK